MPGQPPAAQDDPLAALERLQSLGSGPTAAKTSSRSSSSAPAAKRPRPAAAGLPVARIAAPAVFLVAVVVLISLLFQSGVIGGSEQTPVTQPTPAATKSKKATGQSNGAKASATKTYVVKSGDTPSGIAAKYSISLSELESLNPSKDFTTLSVGEKLKVPKQ